MAEKDKTITILVSTAVILILALALIGSIATQTQQQTTQTTVANEVVNIAPARLTSGAINITYPFTVANPPTGWETETSDCNIHTLAYGNVTTDFTLTADYTASTAGVLLLKNTQVVNISTSNSTYVDYTYCGAGYINSSWGRTVLNLTPGLIALAILVMVILGAYSLLGKQEED